MNPESRPRSLALDVFRGLTVCFMIVVNSPGLPGVAYGPLLHARWHGFTPTDAVFPSFLFVVGVAMAASARPADSTGNAEFWRKSLLRFGILFLLGYLMYWFPFVEAAPDGWRLKPLGETRIPGVLQRIALCALLASVLLRFASRRATWAAAAGVLVGYWIVLRAFGDPPDPYGLHGNAVLKLDRWLLGEKHLYHGEGIAFDPEGLLSTFPATVNVLAGYWAGERLRDPERSWESLAKVMRTGVLAILAALIWDLAFPINKKLWTSSFVLLTVGIDLLLYPMLCVAAEGAERRPWARFTVVFGRNPLFVYLLSELLLTVLILLPWRGRNVPEALVGMLSGIAGPLNASLAFAVLFMLACWAAGGVLHRKGILIRV